MRTAALLVVIAACAPEAPPGPVRVAPCDPEMARARCADGADPFTCAWIRELGYRASTTTSLDGARLAVAAKLGTLDPTGKLVTAEYGTRVDVADVIRTDLPLTAA